MTAPVSSASSSQTRRSEDAQRAQQAAQQQAQQAQLQQAKLQEQQQSVDKASAPQTAEAEARRGRVSGEVQTASRHRTQAAERAQRDHVERQQQPQASEAGIKRGIAAAQRTADRETGTDPTKQPVMVLAPQFGDGQHDTIVKNSYEKVKANAEKNGFKVIDAANLTGDELKQKVAAELPKGHTGPLVAWTGGHGSVAQDKGENKTEHEISTSNKDGDNREIRTGEDILRPIYDGAKERASQDGSGQPPKMTAFVGSCRAGEAANDLAETFSAEEQKSLAVVTSSGRDQLSNGEGMKGVESATLGFIDMMASDSKTRAKADRDGDGAVSADEFVGHLNTEGGGLAVPREKDLDGDQRPDEIQLDSQKLQVAGQGDNPLVPQGTGAPGWDASDGDGLDPNRPMTKDQARAQAKELQNYLEGVYGQRPSIVDNPKTAGGVNATYDAGGRTLHDGGATVRENDDGSKTIKAGSQDEGYLYEEQVAPGGKKSSYAVTDPATGKPFESGTKTYDAQGRPLTDSKSVANAPHLQSHETTWQYDDKDKPTSTETITYQGGSSTTTRSFNDPTNQGPWHNNDVSTITEHKDAEGKVFERTTSFNRPDTEAGKPYTMSKTELIDPSTGTPFLTKSTSSSAKVGTTWTGPDGQPIPEATVRQHYPQLFQRN
jgi:hypothetical protein